jgi:nucleotide-binding universal stress UspA family protein
MLCTNLFLGDFLSSKLPEKGKILVPVDGSESSNQALSYAIDLAIRYSARIKLVHVAPYTTIFTGVTTTTTTVLTDSMLVQNGKQVLSDCLREVEKIGVKASTQLLRGHPGMKIVQYAKDEGFNLIVMGNRGLSGISRFVMGSVSHYVVDHAQCPVTIVK